MEKKRAIIFLFIFILLAGFKEMTVFASTDTTAKNGIFSIKEWSEEDIIKLDGEWEFYWKVLFSPEDFEKQNIRSERQIVPVPVGRNGFLLADGDIISAGYGTYRLILQMPEEEVGTNKALYISGISSSYNLWVNGILHETNGTVGYDYETSKPESQRRLVLFEVTNPETEIIIQAANFHQRKAGIFDSILVGEPDTIRIQHERNLVFRMLIDSSLLIIGLYHFVLFAQRPGEKSFLYFGLLCIFIVIRSILLDETIKHYLFPFLSWQWASKLEYITASLAILFFSSFVHSMYKEEMRRTALKIIAGFSIGYSLFVASVPVLISTKTMFALQLITFLILLYLLFVYAKVIFRKREGYILNVTGTVILSIAVLHDILLYSGVIQSAELVSIGLIFYLFIQAVIIAKNYSRSFARNELLANELFHLNESLEEKVEIRTEELREMNRQLNHLNRELQEAHETNNELIKNIVHEVGTPLTIIQSYTKGMMDGIIATEFKYIELVYDKSVYLSKILEDLQALADLESKKITLNMSRTDIHSFCQKIYEKYSLILEQKGISLFYHDAIHNGTPVFVRMDERRIEQVMLNLFSNSERFVGENGRIEVELSLTEKDEVMIRVSDNGPGIHEEELELVFNRFYSNNISGMEHEGAGLGLAISKEIVESHGGTITVENMNGAVFSITLPVVQN